MIMQQGILDLLNTEDITNIKLGIILARTENIPDSIILKNAKPLSYLYLDNMYCYDCCYYYCHNIRPGVYSFYVNVEYELIDGYDSINHYNREVELSDSIQYSIVENEAAKVFLDLILNI